MKNCIVIFNLIIPNLIFMEQHTGVKLMSHIVNAISVEVILLLHSIFVPLVLHVMLNMLKILL